MRNVEGNALGLLWVVTTLEDVSMDRVSWQLIEMDLCSSQSGYLNSCVRKTKDTLSSPLLDVPHTSQSIYSFLPGFESRRLPQSLQKTSAPMAVMLWSWLDCYYLA